RPRPLAGAHAEPGRAAMLRALLDYPADTGERAGLAAKALRTQERLGCDAIDDAVLAALMGVRAEALTKTNADAVLAISFALKQGAGDDRVLLRSRYATGRRFELARLLGDRLLGKAGDALYPATRSTTYRQKAQRAFAAELLSPFDEVTAMLDGDYSAENQQEVAEHFKVSEMTIRTQLVNHRVLDRDELESGEFALAA
ncbi:MAG: ImmA/IrrE family metallo-endopeptidase, partial [Gammaproteobacteria bacterium]